MSALNQRELYMDIREKFIQMWNKEYPPHRHISFNVETQHFVNINNSLSSLQAEAAFLWFRYGVESQPTPAAPKLPTIKLGPTGEWDNPGMGLPKEWDSFSSGYVLARVEYQLNKHKIPWVRVNNWE